MVTIIYMSLITLVLLLNLFDICFSWNRILGFIVNLDDVQVINGKLKDKDRNIIKERFSVSCVF